MTIHILNVLNYQLIQDIFLLKHKIYYILSIEITSYLHKIIKIKGFDK